MDVIVVSAGGHARVVSEALRAVGHRVVGFTDANSERQGTVVDAVPVLGDDAVLNEHRQSELVLANGLGSTGRPTQRKALQDRLSSAGWRFIGFVHPRAVVSPHAVVHAAAQVMAGAVVQAGAVVANGCIINTGAIVDHDCVLGAYCHVAPRAVLSGGVTVGSCSHIGVGAAIVQGVHLGDNTIVAAGAVVLHDSPGGETLIGMPARAKLES